jgi:hypothetical protein
MISMEEVWRRIALHEGCEFRQKRGKVFVYKMNGNAFVPNTTNISITKSEIQKAWNRLPINGPGEINDLMAPSYLYAILNDQRISGP